MRTTVRLDANLMVQARKYALETGKTLTRLIEEALREKLARRAPSAKREWVTLPTDGNGGVLPGVDLDNNAALLDIMEGR